MRLHGPAGPVLTTRGNPGGNVAEWHCADDGHDMLLQVMEHTVGWMRKRPGQQVFRAHFSAISGPEINAAMVRHSQSRQSMTGQPPAQMFISMEKAARHQGAKDNVLAHIQMSCT